MAIEISNSLVDALPSSVKTALGQMPGDKQAMFEEEYRRKLKNPTTMLLLAIFFPIHYFLMDKVGLGVLYWVTGAACGVWWIIDIIRIHGLVKQSNEDLAKGILRDMKIMGS